MINPINSIVKNNPISSLRNTNSVSFRGMQIGDSFEKQKGVGIKKVGLKDINDKNVEAYIISKESTVNGKLNGIKRTTYALIAGGDQYGNMTTIREKDHVYLEKLETREPSKREYKNAGTELVKCAVEESMKAGFGGKVELVASYSPSPVAFYYKNNFRVPKYKKFGNVHYNQQINAGVDYAIRNNVPFERVIPDPDATYMELDEEGAKALLENRRLYRQRITKKLFTRPLQNHDYGYYFIQSPHKGEFLFLVADESISAFKNYTAYAVAGLKRDNLNRPYMEVFDMDCEHGLNSVIARNLCEAIKETSRSLGINTCLYNNKVL